MTVARQRLGAHGERVAARRYEADGYEVLARNWRCGDGELDLVLRRGDTVVFAEAIGLSRHMSYSALHGDDHEGPQHQG